MLPKHPLTYIIFSLFIILTYTVINVNTEQHFVTLARSFLNGKLTIDLVNDNISDLVVFQGKYYWPLGPLPSILIAPFLKFQDQFIQGFITTPLTLLNYFLLYKIGRKFKLSWEKSHLGAIFLIFGSIYTPLALLPASWYYAQIVACTFIILALYEFLNKRRYFLIGLSIAAAVATRFNLIFSTVFFLYFLLKKPDRSQNLIKLVFPVIISLIFLGTYNYARFQNPLEQGYNLQVIPQEATQRREVGLFSFRHIPSNLFYMLLKGPEPVLNAAHELKPPFITFDSYGLSLIFLSPILILLYKVNLKKELMVVSLATSIMLLMPLLTYYGIGHKQVGFRYALDFYPFLYLLIIDAIKKTKTKIVYPLVFIGVCISIFFSFLYLGGVYIN